MNSERWQLIKDVFHGALELEPSSRSSFLEEACQGDTALLAEVERLLGSHQQAGDFIEHPHFLSAEGFPPTSSDLPSFEGQDLAQQSFTGRNLGAYRLIRRIGHGGMGTVFLAERSDDQYQQRVAIKLIRLGMDSPYLVSRFRQERQILAHLEHPGIARLLDGGNLEDGLPYLVMEYIEGEPIDLYCQTNNLPISERLALFRRVCEAVQFAHRNLVIHRDIKPSNILVTADGTPKLLDFGTSKLLAPLHSGVEQGAGESGLAGNETMTGFGLLTPRYASPEQLKSESITTAADVYSLGIVLYELLTDQRPFDLPSPFSLEGVRILCEESPRPPSEAVLHAPLPTKARRREEAESENANVPPNQPRDTRAASNERRRWARNLQGDLDTIVLTAIRKEPSRRYPSVEQLSGDVQKHLDDLPLLARPDTWSYRWGKFLRRHRTAVLTSSAALLILFLAAAVTWSQSRRARAADARALEHAAEAETITQFLLDLFSASDPGRARGMEISARELLERGEHLVDQATGAEPAVQARLLHKLGQVYLSIGDLDRADELLGRALDLRRELGVLHEETAAILLRRGLLLRAQGKFDASEAATRESYTLREQIFGRSSREVAESLDALGELQYARGDYAGAKVFHSRSRDVLADLPETELAVVAQNFNDLGTALYALGELDAAEAHFLEALELRRQHWGNDHFSVALTLDNLAALAAARGSFEEALAYSEEALALGRVTFGPKGHRQVATTLTNLGSLLHSLQRHDEAESALLEALDMKRDLLGPRHRDTAASLHTLAVFYQDSGAVTSATDHYQQACNIWIESLGEENEASRSCLQNLSWHLHWSGESRAAETLFRRQMAIEEQSATPDHQAMASLHLGLGLSLKQQGIPSEALPHFRQGYRLRSESFADQSHPKITSARNLLIDFLVEEKRFSEAETTLLRSLKGLPDTATELRRDLLTRLDTLSPTPARPPSSSPGRQ